MKTERLRIDELHADPSNVRTHNERNLTAIKASLVRFGQQKPVVVDANGVVRAGNGTLAAAKALGWAEIEVVRTELAGSEATAYAIADNRSAELAEWDDSTLAAQLGALQAEGIYLAELGFNEKELEDLLGKVEAEPAGDESGLLPEKFEVLIECSTEAQQGELLARLTSEGFKCRSLIS